VAVSGSARRLVPNGADMEGSYRREPSGLRNPTAELENCRNTDKPLCSTTDLSFTLGAGAEARLPLSRRNRSEKKPLPTWETDAARY
jgi:hypothetical protein